MKFRKMSFVAVLFPLAMILGNVGGCSSDSTADGASDSASCQDGVKNGGETDIDCGGSDCAACLTGHQCVHGSDCASGVCTNNTCVESGSAGAAGSGGATGGAAGAMGGSAGSAGATGGAAGATGGSAGSAGATGGAAGGLGNGWDNASSEVFKKGDRLPMVVYALYLRGKHSMASYKKIVDQAAAHHFTHVSMVFWMTNLKCPSLVKGGFKFNSTALTIADVKTLADYIRSKGMEAMPGLRLLTHQDDPWKSMSGGVGASFPFPSKYMLNESTYDPNNKELMGMIYGCIDEMMPAFIVNGKPPVRFNIGHDEVVGLWPYDNDKWLTCDSYSKYGTCKPDQPGINCDPVLSADDYKNSILGLRKAITGKYGTRIAMYSDPLVQHEEVVPIEGKFNGHAGCVQGSANPFVQLRKSLPKDIIMMPWWYGFNAKYPANFPEFRILQKEGFDVQPTAWPRPVTEPANFAHVTQRIDEMLAVGHRHSGIVATEFRAYEMYWDDVLQGIAKTGDYAYTTVKK